MRQFTIGLLNKTDGSAKLVNGDTVVIASVVGPKETTNDSTSAQVVVKWSSEGDVRDETDAERKRIIQKVIESLIVKSAYPRTVTRIGVTVLRDNGSLLSTAINAVMMALVDSGIMMNGLATASTCAVLEDGESGRVPYWTPYMLNEDDVPANWVRKRLPRRILDWISTKTPENGASRPTSNTSSRQGRSPVVAGLGSTLASVQEMEKEEESGPGKDTQTQAS